MTAAAATAQGPWQRALMRLKENRSARISLWLIGLLLLAGSSAPLVTNEVPLLARVEGRWSSPALSAFDAGDVCWTGGGASLLLLFLVTRLRILRRGPLRAALALLLLVNVVVWAVVARPANPAITDWRALEAAGETMVWAPVPHGWRDVEERSPSRLTPPGYWSDHPLGTDSLGRDVLSRLLHGTRVSLLVGFFTVGLSVIAGCILGALAGYLGGRVDAFLSWLVQVVMCFPVLFAVIVLQAFLPPGVIWVVLLLAIVRWTGAARLMRGEVRRLRHEDFVSAARVQGLGTLRIVTRHLVPNALAPVVVHASFAVAAAILLESTLSFLGLGVPAPAPSWGELLRQGQAALQRAPHLVLAPGIAIFLTVLAFNVIGEGLRRALDPRSMEGGGLP